MSDLQPIEGHVRAGEVLDPEAALVIRGWPLTVDGLLRNADATRRRYSRAGRRFVAVSADVTMAGWDLDAILSGPRLRTRRSYAAVPIARVVEAGFRLLPTFGAPHYSVVLPSYTQEVAQRLLEVMGEVKVNPHHVRREL
ncbi:MAG TPA: hypothetical protein VFH30_16090 [Acidimicrobiales bacterium]|nr:hypothetical protein [Acidimicrobiales bacterium]